MEENDKQPSGKKTEADDIAAETPENAGKNNDSAENRPKIEDTAPGTIINNIYNIKKIKGDLVGQNQYKSHKDSININSSSELTIENKYILETLYSEEINRLKTIYVKPSDFDGAREILAENNIIILYGRQNTGKRIAAVNLLSDLGIGNIIIFRSQPIDFVELTGFNFKERTGYIFDSVTPLPIGSLSMNSLGKLAQTLKQKGSVIAITIEDCIFQKLNELTGPYSVEWREHINCRELIGKNISYYINKMHNGDQTLTTTLKELLKDERFNKGIAEIGKVKALELVRSVAGLLSKRLSVDEMVDLIEAYYISDIRQMFSDQSDINVKLFLLTLATFNELSYETVVALFNECKAGFAGVLSKADLKILRENNYLCIPRSARLEALSAEIYEDPLVTDRQEDKRERIRFKNINFSGKVIRHIWDQYDYLREPYLLWLIDLGKRYGDGDTAQKISEALSIVAEADFSRVMDLIDEYWLGEYNINYLYISARFFECCCKEGYNDELASRAMSVIHSWADEKGRLKRNIVAAFAYGGAMGIKAPDLAVRDIGKILYNNKDELYYKDGLQISILACFYGLFEASKDSNSLLQLLMDMSGDKNEQINKFSKIIFLRTMCDTLVICDKKIYLKFLWMFVKQGRCKEELFKLWHKCLWDAETREFALETLFEVIYFTERNVHVYDLLEEFVVQFLYVLFKLGRKDDIKRVLFNIDRWSRGREKGAKHSKRLLEKIYEIYKKKLINPAGLLTG